MSAPDVVLCQVCEEDPAIVKVKLETVDGRVIEVHYYCFSCARTPAFAVANLALAAEASS
jgi:protein-arginine kinase activator protein McsA